MHDTPPAVRRVPALVWAALVAATAVNLYLGLTNDAKIYAAGFDDYLAKIKLFGSLGTYRVFGPLNQPFTTPPFMIHVLRAMGWLAQTTHLPFKFWLRLP